MCRNFLDARPDDQLIIQTGHIKDFVYVGVRTTFCFKNGKMVTLSQIIENQLKLFDKKPGWFGDHLDTNSAYKFFGSTDFVEWENCTQNEFVKFNTI